MFKTLLEVYVTSKTAPTAQYSPSTFVDGQLSILRVTFWFGIIGMLVHDVRRPDDVRPRALSNGT